MRYLKYYDSGKWSLVMSWLQRWQVDGREATISIRTRDGFSYSFKCNLLVGNWHIWEYKSFDYDLIELDGYFTGKKKIVFKNLTGVKLFIRKRIRYILNVDNYTYRI